MGPGPEVDLLSVKGAFVGLMKIFSMILKITIPRSVRLFTLFAASIFSMFLFTKRVFLIQRSRFRVISKLLDSLLSQNIWKKYNIRFLL